MRLLLLSHPSRKPASRSALPSHGFPQILSKNGLTESHHVHFPCRRKQVGRQDDLCSLRVPLAGSWQWEGQNEQNRASRRGTPLDQSDVAEQAAWHGRKQEFAAQAGCSLSLPPAFGVGRWS